MFLTRLGIHAKMIVTGDRTQIDLPSKTQSGLIHAMSILEDVKGIARIEFAREDIVRHKLVKRIVDAYEKHQQKERDENNSNN
jgi:phosphate starvation-inducible PhoH-like protein